MPVSLWEKHRKTLSCMQYFILSFSSSLCCTWKGSGTVLGVHVVQSVKFKIMSFWWLWDHISVFTQIVTMVRNHELLQNDFSQSIFLSVIWFRPHHIRNSQVIGLEDSSSQWALSSESLCRCYSTFDPNPAENLPQHYCIFLVSRWPLTAWKAVFGNTLLTLLTGLHGPADELFRFWLSTLFLCPFFNILSQGWRADTK